VAELVERVVSSMSDDAFVATAEGWSAKDRLAHVAAWERRLLGDIQGDRVAERFGLDETAYEAMNTDAFNVMLHARHRDNPSAAMRAEVRASGEALRDTDLLQPVHPDDPDGEALIDAIAGDTFTHYPEHSAAIAAHA
jgi:hypothetical protein